MPDACIERLRAADLILHAGDFTAAEVLEELEALGPPVAAVHGNVDSAELRRRLPEVVFGHSHIPLHERAPDGFAIFNPGSPTDRRRQPHHTMGEAVVRSGHLDLTLVTLEP